MTNAKVQTQQSPKASESKAREDMSAMLLQKRYSPWHWSWKKCGWLTLFSNWSILEQLWNRHIVPQPYWHFWRRADLSGTSLSFTPTVPPRRCCQHAWTPRSKFSSRSRLAWTGQVPVINLMRIVLHRLNIGYTRVYPIINPKNWRWWMIMRDYLLGLTNYQHHTYGPRSIFGI